MIADADISEPYSWVPANSLEVVAFVNHIRTLADQTGTLTLSDEGETVPATVAPSFADDTGDAISGTVGAAISTVQVPAASGNPTPTYAVVGSLPAGLNFSTSTRRITGTPTVAGSGTIRIRATNSQGSGHDWTAAYSFAAVGQPLALPATADQVATVGVFFTITLPLATGGSTPYSYDSAFLPAGLTFNSTTRVLSGTPTTVQTRNVRYRVTDDDSDQATDFFAIAVSAAASVVTGTTPTGRITAYIGGAIQPIETASLQITRRVGERPIAECDLFFRNLNTFRRPRRGEQLQIHESALPLALSAAEDFPVLSFGGEALLSFGGEAVLSLGGHQALDPAISSTLLFGGTVLDSKIVLTHNDRIGRCVVTGTGYAALLDLTIKARYATTHDATCAEVILDLLTRFAGGLGLTFSAASIIASDICPDLIFGFQFLSQAITLVADAGNVVWCVDEYADLVIARSRDHLVRFDQTTRGDGFTVREGIGGTVERIEHREDPTNFANEVTVIGSAPQISTARDEFTGDGATTSWPLAYQVDAVTDVDVVDAAGSIQDVESFGGDGDAWQVDTRQARIMQRDGDTPLPNGWKVRVTYNFHLPVIHTASDAVSIATYGLVAAPVEENPELDTIESVSQRATSRLRRHTVPTQVLDLMLRPGTPGPFEGHGVPIFLPRHGLNNEIWLVEEVEIEELESQLLQWRITCLQRDHESLYAQSIKPHPDSAERAREYRGECQGFSPSSLTPPASGRRAICSRHSSAVHTRSGSRRISGRTFPVQRGRSAPRRGVRDICDSVDRDRETGPADERPSGDRRRAPLQPDHGPGARGGRGGDEPSRRLPRLPPAGAR